MAWCSALLLSGLAAEDKDADAWMREGVEHFFAAKPKESLIAFDRVIALAPSTAPQLWQRGITLYYQGEFQAGRRQFELHQTVNPRDVENAVWHFLCVAKSEGLAAARLALIPIDGDVRVPMKEVFALFAGTGPEEAVLRAADAPAASEAELRNHRCYAHLYLGLHHEALGHTGLAKSHLLKAARDHRMDHYMGRVAQVHVVLRGWDRQP
jgi:lipoprotein NlpI